MTAHATGNRSELVPSSGFATWLKDGELDVGDAPIEPYLRFLDMCWENWRKGPHVQTEYPISILSPLGGPLNSPSPLLSPLVDAGLIYTVTRPDWEASQRIPIDPLNPHEAQIRADLMYHRGDIDFTYAPSGYPLDPEEWLQHRLSSLEQTLEKAQALRPAIERHSPQGALVQNPVGDAPRRHQVIQTVPSPASTQQGSPQPTAKTCAVCGSDLAYMHPKARYCSTACRMRAYRARKEKEKEVEKTDVAGS
jgi:hypothetical protein